MPNSTAQVNCSGIFERAVASLNFPKDKTIEITWKHYRKLFSCQVNKA